MADQPTTPSGSRWEPDPDAREPIATPETTQSDATAPPADDTTVVPAAPLDDAAAEERRAQLRTRAVLAGAATALTLGGGLTGFVIGHSTAGDDGFRPANFTQQGGPGQLGNQGQFGNQVPPNVDRDGDGRGPGDGFAPGGPGTNSSGTNSSGTNSSGTTGSGTTGTGSATGSTGTDT